MSNTTDFLRLRDQLTHPLDIDKKIQETPDSYSFRFRIPADLKEKYEYRAGQFVTLFLNVDGHELKRSYSLSTSPRFDSHFQITVKQVPGGKGSNYLAESVKQGDQLYVTAPQGTFYQPLPTGKKADYFFFAAGSGITPVFSILKETLRADPTASIYLLFANRDEEHIIYKDMIDKLAADFYGRLVVRHQLSSPKGDHEDRGRCNENIVRDFVTSHKASDSVQAYVCGPDGFMESVISGLKISGLSDQEIRRESFNVAVVPQASNTAPSDGPLDGVIIGDPSAQAGTPKTLNALINGEQIEISVDPEMSILENLINNGKNPPYSCMDGACMACMAKVTVGKVIQDDYGILTDENIEAGEALTCQAKLLSESVTVDYDNL